MARTSERVVGVEDRVERPVRAGVCAADLLIVHAGAAEEDKYMARHTVAVEQMGRRGDIPTGWIVCTPRQRKKMRVCHHIGVMHVG